MDVHVVSLPKATLDEIPELERAFYLHVGHLRNELMVLQKLLWWSLNNPTGNDVLSTVNVSQELILVRLLAGKLVEGWQLLQRAYFGARISQFMEPRLSETTRDALTELKRYFGRQNIISRIRNEFAFHYSPEHIRNQMAGLDEDDRLAIYLADRKVNLFYHASEVIANSAMLQAVEPGDYNAALRRLLTEVQHVAECFLRFADGCLDHMIHTYLLNDQGQLRAATTRLTQVLRRDEPQAPFFVDDIGQ